MKIFAAVVATILAGIGWVLLGLHAGVLAEGGDPRVWAQWAFIFALGSIVWAAYLGMSYSPYGAAWVLVASVMLFGYGYTNPVDAQCFVTQVTWPFHALRAVGRPLAALGGDYVRIDS
ncbi:hypothetical protein [Paraburkholderia youngii]|uniref:hypothetical protein n=1 Tax=Paraburkholderia youngii TaxID=2782701 RepID=UPI003D194AC8